MLVPYYWLKEYVDFKLSPKELGAVLTEIGFSIEAFHQVGGEPVLELEITPNRPDCLSIIGIAREVAGRTGNFFKPPRPNPIKEGRGEPLPVSVLFDVCPRYSAVSVTGARVRPSPAWLQKRISQVGLRPINNLVDISNYVMFEFGIPNHFFDQDKIAGGSMVMFKTQKDELFTTVDEMSYQLPKGALVFKDQDKIIDLCGIKGGLNSAILPQTRSLHIHVPIYDPLTIRRTRQALDINSEAAMIYERGPDRGGTLSSLSRALELTLKLAGGQVSGRLTDLYQKPFGPRQIELTLPHLNSVLGITTKKEEILKILSSLGLQPKISRNLLTCQIPTFRADLQIPEDLIEEIARHLGYNNFPTGLPRGEYPITAVPYGWDDQLETEIKQLLISAGFSEVATYSLMSQERLLDFGYNPKEVLRLANPVSKDYQYLQPSLIPSLVEAAKSNLVRTQDINLFELGHVFEGNLASHPQETTSLAVLSFGSQYLRLKGLLETITARLNIPTVVRPFIPPSQTWPHPTRTAEIKSDSLRLGRIGEIHPKVLTKLDLGGKPFTFLELNYEILTKLAKKRIAFQPLPIYPEVIEDLTFDCPPRTLIGEVIKTIRGVSPLINQVELVDRYQNAVTFRIKFQDPAKNLSKADVSGVRKTIVHLLKENFLAQVKGG